MFYLVFPNFTMEATELKYKSDILKHAPIGCPPINAIQNNIDAYRFVKSSIDDNDNFKTHINLGRLPRQTHTVHIKCSHCAISLFNSENAAILKFKEVGNYSSFKSFEYTHLAKGAISKEDGLCTEMSKEGHFDLHEYIGVELKRKFSIIKSLSGA